MGVLLKFFFTENESIDKVLSQLNCRPIDHLPEQFDKQGRNEIMAQTEILMM